jgi:hypothetical protein
MRNRMRVPPDVGAPRYDAYGRDAEPRPQGAFQYVPSGTYAPRGDAIPNIPPITPGEADALFGGAIPCGQSLTADQKRTLAAQWDAAHGPGGESWFWVGSTRDGGHPLLHVSCPGNRTFVVERTLAEDATGFDRLNRIRRAWLVWAVDQVLLGCCGPTQVSTPCSDPNATRYFRADGTQACYSCPPGQDVRFPRPAPPPGSAGRDAYRGDPYCAPRFQATPFTRLRTFTTPRVPMMTVRGAPLQELGQFDLPDPGDLVPIPFQPGSQNNPFECGPCETYDFAANRCVRSDAPPAEGCPSDMVWDPSVCLCVVAGTRTTPDESGKPPPEATTGVSTAVVVGTVVLVGGALLLAGGAFR